MIRLYETSWLRLLISIFIRYTTNNGHGRVLSFNIYSNKICVLRLALPSISHFFLFLTFSNELSINEFTELSLEVKGLCVVSKLGTAQLNGGRRTMNYLLSFELHAAFR